MPKFKVFEEQVDYANSVTENGLISAELYPHKS